MAAALDRCAARQGECWAQLERIERLVETALEQTEAALVEVATSLGGDGPETRFRITDEMEAELQAVDAILNRVGL